MVLSMRGGSSIRWQRGEVLGAYHQDVIGAQVFPLIVEFCGLRFVRTLCLMPSSEQVNHALHA